MVDAVYPASAGPIPAPVFAASVALRTAANGVRFVTFGDLRHATVDVDRIVAAVPAMVAPGLAGNAFYFVPLALPARRNEDSTHTLIAPISTPELADEAICHRNVTLTESASEAAHQAVFISAGLLQDKFALAFEFFINVGHLFAAAAGIPEAFATLAWSQALSEVRGETSQDAAEARTEALLHKPEVDEKARTEFLEAAFADALAIYQLALAVDFDYSELREREYPLLAPTALAERLRLMARLFPPNDGFEFAIKYRRRA